MTAEDFAEASCLRKKAYGTVEEAGRVAALCWDRRGVKELRVYACPICEGFHLTSTPLEQFAAKNTPSAPEPAPKASPKPEIAALPPTNADVRWYKQAMWECSELLARGEYDKARIFLHACRQLPRNLRPGQQPVLARKYVDEFVAVEMAKQRD